jgi:hypothetical protein
MARTDRNRYFHSRVTARSQIQFFIIWDITRRVRDKCSVFQKHLYNFEKIFVFISKW